MSLEKKIIREEKKEKKDKEEKKTNIFECIECEFSTNRPSLWFIHIKT